jgi:hypothetical protein
MPDDMLEDSIAIAKKTLDEHDFETDGVEVSTFKSLTLFLNDTFVDSEKGQEVHG